MFQIFLMYHEFKDDELQMQRLNLHVYYCWNTTIYWP